MLVSGIALLLAGCDVSGSSADGSKEVSVKMKLQNTSQAKLKSAGTPSVKSLDRLTEVKLLVEELELESAMDEDSLDFEAEDLIANLPLDGSEFTLSSEMVPEGIYDEFELEVENDDSNVSDPDFYNGHDDGYSLVIKRVYNGEEFTYRSDEDFEIELELNPPLEVTANGSSFTVNINIDPSGWFTDSQGQPLDPTDPANEDEIDDNIEDSFEADYEEEDNGDDDDDQDDDDDVDD